MKWAPPELHFTLYGATSNIAERPIGHEITLSIGNQTGKFIPIVGADPSSVRQRLPLTVRYLLALQRYISSGRLRHLDVLDFHRIDPLVLFRNDPRPKNVMIHMDMIVIRQEGCDIGWRHAPWLYEALERRLFPRMDRVYCVRQTAIERYKRTYPNIADRFAFMPTWVDTMVFRPWSTDERQRLKERVARRLGIGAAQQILVTVGRLDRQKDPMLLLDTFESALNIRSDLHLVIIGDGILRPQVEERCLSTSLAKKVTLLGAQPPAEIADILRASDTFVLCSAYEGMPIVLLEALATGLPVVTTDVGEVRLVVQTGVNGAVVSERTASRLATAIVDTLASAASLRGAPCERAVEPYAPERVLSRIYDNHRRQGGTRK